MSRVHSAASQLHTHRAAGPAVLDLIDRLAKAEAGSRELDRLVGEATGQQLTDGFWRYAARCTTSLDAALALADRVLPGWTWLALGPDKDGRCPTLCFARLASPDFDCVTWEAGDQWTTDVLAGRDATAHAATPALALCIAVLRATTPAEHVSVGTSEASAPLQSPETPEGREERS
ncbi:MAG: hypothetical protein ACO1SX_06875 [Actinomycetota bacterium]